MGSIFAGFRGGLRKNLVLLDFFWLNFFWLGFFCLGGIFSPASYSRSFLDSPFETLDTKALRVMESAALEAGERHPEAIRAEAIRDLLFSRFFIAERRELEGKLHAASDIRNQIGSQCEILFPEEKKGKSAEPALQPGEEHFLGLSAAVCVLNQLSISSREPAWRYFGRRNWINAVRDNSEDDLEMIDRLYFDGRFYFENPGFFGGRIGRSLIAFQSILRLRLDVPSPLYWMAKIHERTGNWEAAEDNYDSALRRNPPDVRSTLVYGDTQWYQRLRERNDLGRFGWGAGIFYDPAKGLGGGVRGVDDALWDTARNIEGSAEAGTRGVYEGKLHYADAELMAPRQLLTSLSFFRGVEDFYGFSTNASSSALGHITTTRFEGRAAIKTFWDPGFCAELGWMVSGYKGEDPTGTAPTALNSSTYDPYFLSGPLGSIEFNNTDSQILPLRGTVISLEGIFPQTGFGSDFSFKRVLAKINHTFRLDGAHYLDVHLAFRGQDGAVPFGALTRLNSDFGPGLRDGRFTDRWLGSLSLTYRQKIWGPISGGLFGNLIDGGGEFNQMVAGTAQAGGGLEAMIQNGATRGDFIRVEAGYLADVLVVKLMAGQRL